MHLNLYAAEIPTSTVLWLDYKPLSPNQLLHKHWRVAHRNTKAAKDAWESALQSSPCAADCLTRITMLVRASRSVMPYRNLSASTTETNAFGGNASKSKPGDAKEPS